MMLLHQTVTLHRGAGLLQRTITIMAYIMYTELTVHIHAHLLAAAAAIISLHSRILCTCAKVTRDVPPINSSVTPTKQGF